MSTRGSTRRPATGSPTGSWPAARRPAERAARPRPRGPSRSTSCRCTCTGIASCWRARRRARPALAAPAAVDPHAAGGAVRVPPGPHAGPAGLRPGPGRPVGVLPAAGPGAAAAPPGGGLVDVRGPGQGGRGRVPAHPRRRAAACRPGPLHAVEGAAGLRRRRLQAQPAPGAGAGRLHPALAAGALPAGTAQLPLPDRPAACRATSHSTPIETSAGPRCSILPRSAPATSSSTTAAITASHCCRRTASAKWRPCSASSATPADGCATSSLAAAATKSSAWSRPRRPTAACRRRT